MKRVVLLVLAGLIVVGLAVLSADDVPTDSNFDVPRDYDFEYSGDVQFPSDSQVGNPGAVGWFVTNAMTITFKTNYNLTIGLYQSAFHNDSTILPTQAGGWGALFAGWLDPWVDITQATKYWVATHSFSPGVYGGTFRLRVYRNGYNDPAGTYVSDCYIAVYEG